MAFSIFLTREKKQVCENLLNYFMYLPVRFVLFRFSSLQVKDILVAGFQQGTPPKTVNNH